MRRSSPLPRWVCILAALPAFAQTPSALDEAEALLVQPYVRSIRLGDGIQVFPHRDTVLAPLGELSHLLGFAIDVNGLSGYAEGFFIDPKRTFKLHLAAGHALIEGTPRPFEAWQVRPFGGDLYVDLRLLQLWFPLNPKAALNESSLYITPRERLPVEAAWDRDRTNARLLQNGAHRDEHKGPLLDTPYRFLSLPLVDAAAFWNRTKSIPSRSPIVSFNTGGDLLWMSSNLFALRDDQGSWKGSRATLFREDPDGNLLGLLHARHLSLYDLQQSTSMELVGAMPPGRGVAVDNYPTSYRSAFATRSFQGPIPVGWTVELFQNGGLLGYQQATADGRYAFPEVPLTFGLNLFKLVFHGPHGESREETYRLDISQDMPEPGSFRYRAIALRPRDASPLATGGPQLTQDTMTMVEGETGLSPRFAVKAGTAQGHYTDGTRTYALAGVRSLLPFLSMDLTAGRDKRPDGLSGQAMEAVLRTGLDYSSLQLRRSVYRDGFQPFAYITSGARTMQIRSETLLTMSTALPFKSLPTSLVYNYQEQRFLEGGRAYHRLQAGFNFGNVNLSQAFGLNREWDQTRSTRQLEGTLLATAYFGVASYQADVRMLRDKDRGGTHMAGWNLRAARAFVSGIRLEGGFRGTRSLGDASTFAHLTQQSGRVGYGVDVSWTRGVGYSIGLRVQTSFGRDPHTGRWFTQAQPLSGLGAVSARAFLDLNQNGRFDAGERLLQDVSFRVGDMSRGEWRPDPTVAVYTQLARAIDSQLQVDTATLEDTTQVPAVASYTVRPRAGTLLKVDVPIAILGEVNGTVRLRRAGKTREISGLEIQLVKPNGEVARSMRSAFDGFFEFRELPQGEYTLRVASKDEKRLKLRPGAARRIVVTNQQSLFEGQDLVVELEESPTPPPVFPDAPKATVPDGPTPLHPDAPSPMAQTRPEGPWTLSLLVARRPETLERALQHVPDPERAHLSPLGDGLRTRLCFGSFSTQEEAELSLRHLPAYFRQDGNRPHAFRTH